VLASRGSGSNYSRRVADYRFACPGCGIALRYSPDIMRKFIAYWLLPLPIIAWLATALWPAAPAALLGGVALWGMGFPVYWLATAVPVIAPSGE
jgi:hypothetical protein